MRPWDGLVSSTNFNLSSGSLASSLLDNFSTRHYIVEFSEIVVSCWGNILFEISRFFFSISILTRENNRILLFTLSRTTFQNPMFPKRIKNVIY